MFCSVTLYTRVWIEIAVLIISLTASSVTLYTRVWIEMVSSLMCLLITSVTLYTRVWIEIHMLKRISSLNPRHPLHEGVD